MYKLPVKLDGIERRKRTTGLLHIAAGCWLLLKSFDYLRLQQGQHAWTVLPFFLAALAAIVYGVFKKFWDPAARFNPWLRLMQVCIFSVLAMHFLSFNRTLDTILLFAWAIGCLLLMFTERKVFHDAGMQFGQEGIFIPGYFTNRRLFWNNIKDVIVRPDYITIFQKDDTFLQYEVLKNMNASELDEIALYCREQIHSKAALK